MFGLNCAQAESRPGGGAGIREIMFSKKKEKKQ